MIIVKTRLDKSPIHGVGVFAAEDIAKGTIVWKFHLGIDLHIRKDQVAMLEPFARDQIEQYGYTPIGHPDLLLLCGGHGAYINHSNNPNVISKGDFEVAARDIKSGEELTSNYGEWDAEFNPSDYEL